MTWWSSWSSLPKSSRRQRTLVLLRQYARDKMIGCCIQQQEISTDVQGRLKASFVTR